jgi:hypothetical protein
VCTPSADFCRVHFLQISAERCAFLQKFNISAEILSFLQKGGSLSVEIAEMKYKISAEGIAFMQKYKISAEICRG